MPALLEEIAQRARGDRRVRGRGHQRLPPAMGRLQVTSVAGSPEMRDALMGATYDRARWLPVVLDERFARCGAYFIPEGAIDWSANGARYLPDLDRRVGPRCVAPRRRALRPLPGLCRAHPGRALARRSGQRPAPVGRRPRLPRRGRSLGRVCPGPWPARPGGRAPPRGAGGAARRVLQARLPGLDRAGPRGGVLRRGARSRVRQGRHRAHRPRDGIAATPRERRLAGGPANRTGRCPRRPSTAARPGVRDRRLLPAPGEHGARASAAVR